MKIITLANVKSNVGKTTLSVLLSRYLSLTDRRVLLVDADPQGTATLQSLIPVVNEEGNPIRGLYLLLTYYLMVSSRGGDVLTANKILENTVPAGDGSEVFHLLPNSIHSAGLESMLKSEDLHMVFFDEMIRALPDGFDAVVIDTPPFANAFLISALKATDILVIPAETEVQSWPGVDVMMRLVDKYVGKGMIELERIVVVPAKVSRTRTAKSILSLLRTRYADMITENYLPHLEAVNRVFRRKLNVAYFFKDGLKKSEAMVGKLLKELEEVIYA